MCIFLLVTPSAQGSVPQYKRRYYDMKVDSEACGDKCYLHLSHVKEERAKEAKEAKEAREARETQLRAAETASAAGGASSSGGVHENAIKTEVPEALEQPAVTRSGHHDSGNEGSDESNDGHAPRDEQGVARQKVTVNSLASEYLTDGNTRYCG